MKSKTSCCKRTLFKSDLIRFAPGWLLYTIWILLCMVLPMATKKPLEWQTTESVLGGYLGDFLKLHAVFAFGYGLLNAQLLFGDLYTPRLCYALHSLPVKRDTYFWVHYGTGLLFALVPNLLAAVAAMPLLGGIRRYALLWYGGSCVQYFFFFTLAVLCMMLSGNRVGTVLSYGILNFLALLADWFVTAVYGTFLYGVKIAEEPILNFCPGYSMVTREYLRNIYYLKNNCNSFPHIELVAAGWRYLGYAAVAAVILLAIAHTLYRQRKLECAGDLVAFPALKPVFRLLFTLTVGAFFQLFGQTVTNTSQASVGMLLLGMAVGYTASLMLLQRQINVFQPKAFLPLGAMTAVLGISMLLVSFDPLGVVNYIPKEADIASVAVVEGGMDYTYSRVESNRIHLTGEQSLADIKTLHQAALSDGQTPEQRNFVQILFGYGSTNYSDDTHASVVLTYHLKNGRDVKRYYRIPYGDRTDDALRRLTSQPETVLGFGADRLEELLPYIDQLVVYGSDKYGDSVQLTGKDRRSFLEAVIADCKAGHMSQLNRLHPYELDENGYPNYMKCYVNIAWQEMEYYETLAYAYGFYYFPDCEHTLRWLSDHGYALHPDA